MRLCKDCAFLKAGDCVNPRNTSRESPDYVNGIGSVTERIYIGAQFMRKNAFYNGKDICGPEALWFEPKDAA